MAEKNTIFSSKIGYDGIFNFSELYKFCYNYLSEELGFNVSEGAYKEKISGDTKEINIEWNGSKKIDDYFQYDIKVGFQIVGMKNIEIEKGGERKKSNKGNVNIKTKGTIITDYKGEYTTSPIRRFMKNVYDKWVIPSKIDKVEGNLVDNCNDFLEQTKAFLDLEGKK